MKPAKQFDCIEMKRALQLRAEEKLVGLNDEERMETIRTWLNTSSDAVAAKWRAAEEKAIAEQSTRGI